MHSSAAERHDAKSPKCSGLRRWLSSMCRSSTRVFWSSSVSTNSSRPPRSPRAKLPRPTKCQEWLIPIPTKCLLTRIAWTSDFDKPAAHSAIVVEVWCHNCLAIGEHTNPRGQGSAGRSLPASPCPLALYSFGWTRIIARSALSSLNTERKFSDRSLRAALSVSLSVCLSY